MVEGICGWTFTRVVEGVDEMSGLIRKWSYLQH